MTAVTNRPPQRVVRCPGCGQCSEYSSTNPFRPFCGERCKNADFGAWASERYRVDTPPPRDENSSQETPPTQPPH